MKFTGIKFYEEIVKQEFFFANEEEILPRINKLKDAEILLKVFQEGECRFLDPDCWVVHVKHTKLFKTLEYVAFQEFEAEMKAEIGPSCEDWGNPYDTESGVPFQLQEDGRL